VVGRGAELPLSKDVPRLHPAMGTVVHLARVVLEHDPLAGTEAGQVDQRVVALRDLLQEVVAVVLQLEVNSALSPSQCAEIPLHPVDVSLIGEEESFHEGRVDDLAEALLLNQVERRPKNVRGLDLPIEEGRYPVHKLTDKRELNLVRLQK